MNADGAQEERVHDVRTRLKRSRAALELIGAEIGKAAKKTDRRLRNRGRRLARPRDVVVQAHTFRILGARLSRELPAGLLERMRDVGEQMRRTLDEKSVEKELRRTARVAAQAASAPAQAARQSAAGARSARASRAPTARRGGRWRRFTPTRRPSGSTTGASRSKLLSNELKIVGRAVPELATRYLDKVETLGELLGQVHDLDCAAATAERHPRWFGSDADREAVRGLVAEHRVALEREAFALAAGVFAGRPRDVRELVETGWQDLAREPKAEEVAHSEAA